MRFPDNNQIVYYEPSQTFLGVAVGMTAFTLSKQFNNEWLLPSGQMGTKRGLLGNSQIGTNSAWIIDPQLTE